MAERKRGRMWNAGRKLPKQKWAKTCCKVGLWKKNDKLTGNARVLRKQMTKEEAKLWYQFLRLYQPRFHRQYVIGNYIADFYCHQAKLVVELDGSQHYTPEEREYDHKRTTYLRTQGLRVLRFSNLDVMRQFQRVCEVIDSAVKQNETNQQV